MEKPVLMRDRMLHDSLRALTEDASRLLEDLLSSGAEIPFEVGDATSDERSPGMRGSVTMFAYRPLTAEFVSTHADRLRQLPTFENAAQNLARTRGVIAWLRVRNEPVLDVGELTHARLGVLAFLAAVWEDAERFEHWNDRFERAYMSLESVVLAERLVTTVYIPVHGVSLTEGSINLGAGVELIAAAELDPDCAESFSDSAAGADSFCSISVTAPSDAPTPMPTVRILARSLLTALRLFRPGSVALGMSAQADVLGAWHQVSMPFTGRSHEAAWQLRPSDEEELRQFVSAVRRVERRTRIAWSLKRFETGLERTVPADGLTDFLLALRALLEAEDDRGKAALPARVSALCAQDHERTIVRAEVEAAFALERLAVHGHVGRSDRKRLEKQPPLETIAAVERHLRALLHDLVCGYLATDLKSLADEILSADGEPVGDEIPVEEPTFLEPVPAPGAPAPVDPTQTVEFDVVFDDTAEIKAIDMRDDVAAFSPEQQAEQPEDNVWELRPAEELAPAPEVVTEEIVEEIVESELLSPAQTYEQPAEPAPMPAEPAEPAQGISLSQSLSGTVSPIVEPISEAVDDPVVEDAGPLAPPAWEPSPERRPVAERGSAKQVTRGPTEQAGFTFDFDPVTEREPEPAPAPAARVDRSVSADDVSSPAFPIPEFGVPIGRGPAAMRSDDEVRADDQRQRLAEIMDPNFTHPQRESGETASTPIVRSHLSAIDGAAAPEPEVAPRIAPPEQNAPAPLPPTADPGMTVEYDVLGADTSAEEAAQLAWSEQFIRREQEQPAASQPVQPHEQSQFEQPQVEQPAPPRLMAPLRPVDDIVVARLPEVVDKVEPQHHAGEIDRNHRIGPSTIEFRPLVEADPDDPDDFTGAC